MTLQEMIYRRRSTRSYIDEPVDEATIAKIEDYIGTLLPLYPEIKVRAEVVGRERVKCILPWITPQLVAIYSEDREGALENVGFLFQQLDLYLQTIGLGACWLGMGKMHKQGSVEGQDDSLKFMMLLAFGYPKGEALRKNGSEFKRRTLAEIADRRDERLEPARLAPSSVNSQPWYFTHEGEVIHAYCARQGLFKAMALGDMNRMDMGIALAHLCVANPDTFRFYRAESPAMLKGHEYIGSFTLGSLGEEQ